MSERQATLHDERIDLLSAMVVDLRGRLATAEAERDAQIADLHALLRDVRIYVDRMTIQVGPVAHDDIWRARQLLLRIDAVSFTRDAAQDGKP